MVQARIEFDEYTTRVLDVVKGKYGLKNRNEALQMFIKLFGDFFLEPVFSKKDVQEIRKIIEKYERTHKNRHMSLHELDNV